MNENNVEEVLKDSEVVINCLGSTGLSDNLDICSKGTEVILRVMKKLKIKKILTCSSLGVGDSYDQCSYMTRLVIWGILSKVIADKDIQENMIKKSLMSQNKKRFILAYLLKGNKLFKSDFFEYLLFNNPE